MRGYSRENIDQGETTIGIPMKLFQCITFCALALAVTSIVYAQTQRSAQTAPKSATTPSRTTPTLSSAEVLNVYRKEKRVLLKHGPIPNLGMSEMTMEFGVAHPKILRSLKPGGKIMFSAVLLNADYIVTHVEEAR